MMHFYTEMDGWTTLFSDIMVGDYDQESIKLVFEKPIGNGFAHGELMLPDMTWNKQLSMTEDDVFYLEQYALDNSPLIWELSREGNGCLQ